MPRPLRLLALAMLLGGCATAPASPGAPATEVPKAPINATCPRSGKPVATDSLTSYRGYRVGFCNPHCRDDFAADPQRSPADRAFFDALIASLE